jgi:hypothetical protein
MKFGYEFKRLRLPDIFNFLTFKKTRRLLLFFSQLACRAPHKNGLVTLAPKIIEKSSPVEDRVASLETGFYL